MQVPRVSVPRQRMTQPWKLRSIAAMKAWEKGLAEKFMLDCLRRWPAKTSIALLAVTLFPMMVQQSCMNSLASRMSACLPRSATSSGNTGTCSGQSVRCALPDKPQRTQRARRGLSKVFTTENTEGHGTAESSQDKTFVFLRFLCGYEFSSSCRATEQYRSTAS